MPWFDSKNIKTNNFYLLVGTLWWPIYFRNSDKVLVVNFYDILDSLVKNWLINKVIINKLFNSYTIH